MQQGLNQFLKDVERRAYRMAFIATHNRDEALDIVQDAMMKLAQKYAHKPPDQWPPLFYRILQHRITDWYRRRKIERGIRGLFGLNSEDEEQSNTPEIADEADEPSKNLDNHQSMHKLDEILHQLPLRQQQAFLLRTWEGLNVSDTAKIMGCSSGSVKTHYSRAIHTVRQKLEGHWP